MENRLIYFAASAAEKQETGIDAPDKQPDELNQAANDLIRAKHEAKKGGRHTVSEAEKIANSPDTPAFTRILMEKGAKNVKAAATERDKNPSAATTQKMNEALADLENKIRKFEKRKFDNAAVEVEIKQLANLPGAKELFKDLKVSFKSESKGGSIELKWKSEDAENMKKFGLEQKKLVAEAMRKKLSTPEGKKDSEALRDVFLNKSEVPDSWKDWLKKPELGFPGAAEKQKTLGYVVAWVSENLGELVAQTAEFKSITNQAEGNPQSAKQLSEKGVKTSLESFQAASRTERNEILKNYSEMLAGTNAELAERAAKAGVSDKTGTENIQTKNTAAIEKEKAETTATAEKITPQLKKIAETLDLTKLRTARQNELENFGKSETATQAGAQSLRERAQSGEKIGAFAAMKNALGFGKKDAEKDEAGEPKKEENLGDRANREVASDLVGDPKKTDILAKEMGLRPGVSKEDWAKLAPLLALEKFDVPSVSGLMTPEIKSILAKQAAEDSENKMKKAA